MTTYALAPQIAFGLNGVTDYVVYTYESGGTTPANTWSDNGSTLNANPVVLDANGHKVIYIQTGTAYRFVYKTGVGGTTLADVDPVTVADPAAGSGGTSTVTNLTVTGDATIQGDITVQGDSAVTGNSTVGGTLTVTGAVIGDGIKLTALAPGSRNGTIDAAAAANAITFTYETQASATPSTTDPVSVTRRHQTISTGSTHTVNQTGAVSLVLPSGATLGCASSEVVRIHVGLIRNAGSALELACWTAAVAASTNVKTFRPDELVTTTAIGTGSDSAQTMYSTSARTSQPLVYLGFIEATSGATAGQWASVDKIVNWEPGVPLPGDIVQGPLRTDTGTVATGTTVTPGDDSAALITEGDQYMTLSITQKSPLNFIDTKIQAFLSTSLDNSSVHVSMHRNGATAVRMANTGARVNTPSTYPCAIHDFRQAGATSPCVTTVRAGPSAAATVTFNGVGGAQSFGGTYNSYICKTEVHI